MTIGERIKSIIRDDDHILDLSDAVPASMEKLIYIAYYMGRKRTQNISQMYTPKSWTLSVSVQTHAAIIIIWPTLSPAT